MRWWNLLRMVWSILLDHTQVSEPNSNTESTAATYLFPPTAGSTASLVIKQEICWRRFWSLARFKKSAGASEPVKQIWRPKYWSSPPASGCPYQLWTYGVIPLQQPPLLCSHCWFQQILMRHNFEPIWPWLSECSYTDVPHYQQWGGGVVILKWMKLRYVCSADWKILVKISCKLCLIKTPINQTVHPLLGAFWSIGGIEWTRMGHWFYWGDRGRSCIILSMLPP